RDAYGRVLKPALVALQPVSRVRTITAPVDSIVPVDVDLPSSLAPGDVMTFDDVRGRTRRLVVQALDGGSVVAELERTAYVTCGTRLQFNGPHDSWTGGVVNIPPLQQTLLLKKGDTLLLTPDMVEGRLAVLDERGQTVLPARIGMTLPEAFEDVA